MTYNYSATQHNGRIVSSSRESGRKREEKAVTGYAFPFSGVSAQVNTTYNFSATQNNGRIVSAADAVTGENERWGGSGSLHFIIDNLRPPRPAP